MLPGSWPREFAQPPIIPPVSESSLDSSTDMDTPVQPPAAQMASSETSSWEHVEVPDSLVSVPEKSVSHPAPESEQGKSSEISSIEQPPSEEPVDHHTVLRTFAAPSSDSSFGIGRLPSLDSSFDETVHPALATHPQGLQLNVALRQRQTEQQAEQAIEESSTPSDADTQSEFDLDTQLAVVGPERADIPASSHRPVFSLGKCH